LDVEARLLFVRFLLISVRLIEPNPIDCLRSCVILRLPNIGLEFR
jgi:hypothetical protein